MDKTDLLSVLFFYDIILIRVMFMGRAEKYKNILDDDNVNNDNLNLSSTRIIKYKDIHEEIDDIEKEPTREIRVRKQSINIEEEKEKLRLQKQETFMKKGDLFLDLLNKKEQELKKKEIDDNVTFTKIDLKKINNDDSMKKINGESSDNDYEIEINGNSKNVLFVLLILLILIIVLVIFFVYPIVNSMFLTDSKDVYDNYIDLVSDFVINEFDSSKYDSYSALYSYNIDSNLDMYKDNNSYSYFIGKDDNNYINSVTLDDNSNKYSINYINGNNKYYISYNDNKNLYNISNEAKYSDVFDNIDKNNKLFHDGINVLINGERDILKNIITSDYLKRSKDNIMINNKNYSVFKNNLSLTGEEYLELVNKNINSILNNKDMVSELETLYKDNINNILNNLFNVNDINNDDKYEFNIYTNYRNKLVGFDIEKNGFRTFYLYFDKNYNFAIYLNLNDFRIDGLCDSIDCNKSYEFKGKSDHDKINVEVFSNNNSIGKIVINSFNINSVNMEYELIIDNVNYHGKFNYVYVNDKRSLEYDLFYNDMYYKLNKSYAIDTSYKLDLNEYNITNYDNNDNVIVEFNNDYLKYYKEFNNIYKNMFGVSYEKE